MADEQPVPETLESIAASIRELRTTMDARFDHVDERFGKIDERFGKVDERFGTIDARFGTIDARFGTIDARFDKVDTHLDELKAQLRTEIESVRGDVRLVAEGFAAQTVLLERIDKNHRRLEERVDTHDLRILALEPKTPA